MQFSGLRVGHYTDTVNGTGLTVMLLDKLTPCAAFVAGSAPASYDIAALKADALVGAVDAIVFTGGSAPGLGAIAGVSRWLTEQGRGFPTLFYPIPIVAGAAIYDCCSKTPVFPSGDDAFHVCETASAIFDAQGTVGAGTGASIGKLLADTIPGRGGLGMVKLTQPSGLEVLAVAVVNAVGEVSDLNGQWVGGARDTAGQPVLMRQALLRGDAMHSLLSATQHTTLVAVFTNALVDRIQLSRLARVASAGMAQAIFPVFTAFDGDLVLTVATQHVAADEIQLGAMMTEAVRQAIIQGVKV